MVMAMLKAVLYYTVRHGLEQAGEEAGEGEAQMQLKLLTYFFHPCSHSHAAISDGRVMVSKMSKKMCQC